MPWSTAPSYRIKWSVEYITIPSSVNKACLGEARCIQTVHMQLEVTMCVDNIGTHIHTFSVSMWVQGVFITTFGESSATICNIHGYNIRGM